MLKGLDIDNSATAENVRRFLTKDLDKYLALAGAQRSDLKSPTISGMPKAEPVGNSTEDHFLDVIVADKILDCVKRAIANCTLKSSTIIQMCYLDFSPAWEIENALHCSSSQYKDYKRRALCEFAGRYRYQTMQAKIGVDNLNVYK